MKKILLCGALLLSFVSNAQYFVYGFNVVPEDEVEYYIQNEHELFSKAATKAFKKGIIMEIFIINLLKCCRIFFYQNIRIFNLIFVHAF